MIKSLVCCWLVVSAAAAFAQQELDFEPSWAVPTYAQVRGQTLSWIRQQAPQKNSVQQADALWPQVELRTVEGSQLLDRVVETLALLDPRVAALVTASQRPSLFPVPPEGAWLKSSDLRPFPRQNLKLYYARWLFQHGFYDRVVDALAGITTEQVVDPASLLFYRAVAHHQLVQPEACRAVLVRLQEQDNFLPQRYRQVAQLLERDLSALQDESLDHIARRMNDVRRRLGIGLAGKPVQIVEQGVLDSLDRLIKKLEQQQQQASAGGTGGGPGGQPMPDSRLPSMQAPMQVEQRDIGSQSGWGDLPDKEREQAWQQIGREFPAHYRTLVEQYFRELANEAETP